MNIIDKIYDKEFRANLEKDPKKYIQELSYTLDDNVEVVIKKNDKNTTYITMPSSDVLNDSMSQVQAAGTGSASSASCVGSLATAGSVCSTLSSASSGGSVACAGSAT